MIIDELIAILGFDLRGQGDLDRFNSGMERAAALANRMSMAIVAAGAIAAGAMTALGKSVIDVSAEFEGYQTSLETIEGSSEKAKSSMDWITKFAAKTPYELAGVTEAFIKLKSYGIDPMDGTLSTLGDTASAMNKPLDMAVEAFADATSFQFERLREFGIVASQKGEEVTFQWTKSGKTLTKTVKKTGAEVQKFLKEHWGKSFDGAMIRQSKTWSGMMSNLSDSWQLFQKRIGDKGFFAGVKSRLGDLLDYIGELDKNGTLDRWATNLSKALLWVADGISFAAKRIWLNLGTIGVLLDKLGKQIGDFLRYVSDGKIDLGNWESIGLMLAGLLAVLNPAWVAMFGLAVAADDFLTWLRGGKSVIGDLITQINQLMPSIQKAMSDFASAISNMDWGAAGKSIGTGLINGIAEAFKGIAALIASVDWSALGHSLGSAINFKAIGEIWAAAMRVQIQLLVGLWQGLIDGIRNLDWGSIWSAIVSIFKARDDLIVGIFLGLKDRIVEAVEAWFDIDFSAIGKAIGDGIMTGLQSMGDQIKAWFAGLIPDWAKGFFEAEADSKTPPVKNSGVDPKPIAANSNDPSAKYTIRKADASAVMSIENARQARAAGMSPSTDTMPGKTADDLGIGERVMSAVSNLNAHLARMSGDAVAKSVDATITDARQDNRQYPVTANTTVNQTINNMGAAPAIAGAAVGAAVNNAVGKNAQAARTEGSPAF